MATSPQIAQGTLNRLRGALVVVSFPALNVTAAFLGKQMIKMAFSTEAATYIPTATGAVTSGEPYQIVEVTAHLLKTQGLAAAWETQKQTNTQLGTINVITDTSILPAYTLQNCILENVAALSFAGDDPSYMVTIKGYQIINQNLWNLG